MSNYKETIIAGSRWTRACKVILDNPYQGVPSIFFEEEEVIAAEGMLVRQGVQRLLGGDVVERFTDPAIAFPLIDPATDAVVGSATHGQLYAMIYSLYKQQAAVRDDRLVAVVQPTV